MSTENKKQRKVPILGIPMSHKAHLLDTRMFRLALALPVASSAVLFLVALILSWEDLNLCGSTQCFNNFFSNFKFQIGVMGLAIPFGALVASHHRSVQSAHQIEQQSLQNAFSNHIEHRNLFFSFVKDESPLGNVSCDANRLYEAIFPDSVEGNLKPDEHSIETCMELINQMVNLIENTVSSQFACYKFQLNDVDTLETLDKLRSQLHSLLSVRLSASGEQLRAFPNDNFETIKKLISELSNIANGVLGSANFHRSHIRAVDYFSTIGRLASLSSSFVFFLPAATAYKCIRESLGEHVDDSGNLINSKTLMEGSRLESALKDLEERIRGLYSDRAQMFNDVNFIIEQEFPDPAVVTIRKHFPSGWQV